MDGVETKLGLREEKLAATREVMRQYGNTRSSSVFLVMDEMRNKSAEQGLRTPGEGLEWGMLIAFGPGLTLDWRPCSSARYLPGMPPPGDDLSCINTNYTQGA